MSRSSGQLFESGLMVAEDAKKTTACKELEFYLRGRDQGDGRLRRERRAAAAHGHGAAARVRIGVIKLFLGIIPQHARAGLPARELRTYATCG